jgi:hypothetical protein
MDECNGKRHRHQCWKQYAIAVLLRQVRDKRSVQSDGDQSVQFHSVFAIITAEATFLNPAEEVEK